MKKIGLICAVALAGMSLAACGNQSSSNKASSSSKASSSKVVKHHKKQNKREQSPSISASSSINNHQNTQSQNSNASNQVQGQPSNQATQTTNNDPTQSGDIHSFVNQYGVSPALYKMQHYGMSQQQALDSTPDNMKTSGELQVQHQMEGQ